MQLKEMTKDEFIFYFKRQILELRISLSSTIQSILNTKNNSIINIVICDSGTKISYINEKIINGNFVDYRENICLVIGYEELMYMYKNSKENMFDSFNKLVTHEFLHVLFGDLTKKKLNIAYNYANGSLKEKVTDEYYIHNPDKKFDNEGYLKIDNEMYNVAADFVINRELDICSPFLRAEDFDLDPDLNVFQYYSILVNDNETREFVSTKINPLAFVNEDISGKDPKLSTSNIPISNEKMIQVSDEDLLDDLFLGKGRGFGPSSIDFVVKSLKKKKSVFFDYTRKIINEIKVDIFNNQDSPVDQEESWFKYNNRKEESSIVSPGKIYVESPISKYTIYKTIPVIFVDCSGSMLDILKELFYFLYNLLTYVNCTIVFYDEKILKVIKSANTLNFDASMFIGGGTSVKDVIEEYKRDYNEHINNVYIFTDGFDDFSNIDVKFLNIYKFDKGGINKIEQPIGVF